MNDWDDSAPADAVPDISFGPDGLVPAVVQDATTRDVLMVGFMNAEALHATRATGRTHFWSRSRDRLWRKGETSGHEQIVRDLLVNCEQNSMLLLVDQIGAVCHDGYPTCYYRRVRPDGSFEVIAPRAFDPDAVYSGVADQRSFGSLTEEQFGAYVYLQTHDLGSVSTTSRLLHAGDDTMSDRVGDELRELAGVLDGTHGHQDRAADILLEAGQVIYWLTLSAIRAGCDWNEIRPDRALLTAEPGLDAVVVSRMLRREAEHWKVDVTPIANAAARCHSALALVGQACQTAGVNPWQVIEVDLGALRDKPYLQPYFAPES